MSKPFERLFFALWPNQKIRDRLTQSYAKIPELDGQGRLVIPSNLHITLHFLGNIPVQQVDCFIRQARKVQASSFELKLNRPGYFKKPKIGWIGPEQIPIALLRLQHTLGENINHCGYQVETRPYRPHVTMARKVRPVVLTDSISSINWKVDSFALVKSIPYGASVKYLVKMRFPLK